MSYGTLQRQPGRGERLLLGALGVLVVCGLWQLLGATKALGEFWPTLTSVLSVFGSADSRELLRTAIQATMSLALQGFALGAGAALLAATLVTLVPALQSSVGQVAAVLNAIPVIVLGPVMVTSLPRDATPITIAALGVFFTTFVTVTAGFESVRRSHLDVFRVLGASRAQKFWRLKLPAALPSIADALRLGAPAAIIGAVIGEWFGADQGVGPLLISAMQNFQIDMLWAVALLTSLVSIAVYGVLTLANLLVTRRFGTELQRG